MSGYNTALLICPERLSLSISFRKMLQVISKFVVSIDSSAYIKPLNNIIQKHIFRFPYQIREKWALYYHNQINNEILKACDYFHMFTCVRHGYYLGQIKIVSKCFLCIRTSRIFIGRKRQLENTTKRHPSLFRG